MQICGRISSEESFGLADGPGIRYVVFMQGCQLRCKYCHNPETWKAGEGVTISAKKLIDKIKRYKCYFGGGGGVTFSGGEPLLQPKFLKECLKLCKKEGISTVIDTAGTSICSSKEIKEILSLCDIVILDIKATNDKDYRALTGCSINRLLEFIKVCQQCKSKLWLRQVIVPGVNDNDENIKALAQFIKPLKYVDRIELLPYKNLGEIKYKKLKIKYPYQGLENMDEDKCKCLENKLIDLVKNG